MKQNVKKTKRASQKSPRSNPMPEIVTWANCSVNGPYLRNKLRIEPQGEAAKLFRHAGAASRSKRTIPRPGGADPSGDRCRFSEPALYPRAASKGIRESDL